MKHIPWLHHFISLVGSVVSNHQTLVEQPVFKGNQLPVNQSRRKTGVAKARRDARKRRNRK